MGAEGLETLAAPAGYQDALLREGAMRLLVTCLDSLEGDELVRVCWGWWGVGGGGHASVPGRAAT